jgi:F-type H+-transporting ATPase subunit a
VITLLAAEENGGGLHFPPIGELLEWPDIFAGLNKVGLIYLVAVLITIVLFTMAARRSELVPRGVQTVAETSVEFIRDSVVHQTIGPDGMRFMPFLLTLFFFILFSNIFEVLPFIHFPGNARMAMPATLALLVWFVYNGVGIAKQGPWTYFKNSVIPPGVPAALLPLVALIEFVSTFFVRPFSLAVRLFANMLAGHLLLVTFAVLTATLWSKSLLLVILPFTFAVLIALTAFEILVALLQAFIFTILTAVYIGGAMHPEH